MKRTLLLLSALLATFSLHGAPEAAGIADRNTYLSDFSALLQQQWPSNRVLTIVFHGHSVPAGYFAVPVVDTFNAYPYLLHRSLKDRFPYAALNCPVTAIPGETSEKGAKRFERDVLSLHPDVLTIDYSLNDRNVGLQRAETAWRQMIESALQHHVKVLLLTPSIDLKANLDDPNDSLNHHAEMVRRLAREYHVGLVDSMARFKEYIHAGGKAEDLMSAFNHPNRKGHDLIVSELVKWFP